MTRLAFGVTTLLASAALPALGADWNHIGSVTFGDRFDQHTQLTRFNGPVEGLRLAADGAIQCTSVNMTMADGSTQSIFSGTLENGQRRMVDLGGDGREVRNITFNCRSLDTPNASLDIAADVSVPVTVVETAPATILTAPPVVVAGPATVIERAPATVIERTVVGDEFPGITNHDRWIRLGRESFGIRTKMERHMTGDMGRHVQSVGFEPVGADARCMRAFAHYENGDVRALQIGNQEVLREGVLYRIDLPGDRDLRAVDLECHAVGDSRVTINLYGNKDDVFPAAG